MVGHQVILPEGYRDAKLGMIIAATIGEIVQGGLFFGWNALGIMIKDLGNYADGCDPDQETLCKSQESKLAVLWTVGIFALNCGPVLVGFVLDYCGPKFTCIVGSLLNILGLILFGVSQSSGPNAFIPASIFLGLGGITFHLAQMHASALYPRKRGMLTAVFVAGFTGSGIIFYLLLLIFQAAGSTRAAYMGVLMGYAGLCALWIPLSAWMMPNSPFRVGQVYLLTSKWRFEVRQRSDLEIHYRRTTSLQDFVAAGGGGAATMAKPPAPNSPPVVELMSAPPSGRDAVRSNLISAGVPDSSNPFWQEEEEHSRSGISGNGGAAVGWGAFSGSPGPHGAGPTQANGSVLGVAQQQHADPYAAAEGAAQAGDSLGGGQRPGLITDQAGLQGLDGNRGPPSADPLTDPSPLPHGVVWGPLVFEARRFVELRKLSFLEQFKSSESFGMGLFYTLNVFTMQFYLGTMRLQLSNKGSNAETYSNFGNVVVAFAFLLIPVIGWLLDKKGYGSTLGSILGLSVLTLVLQALPSLPLQVVTILIWMTARFFMYASYFAIFGALFGFRNFGRLVAVDNIFNGLFGLLQYPLTYLAIHPLNGNFMWVNLGQAACLIPLSWFCVAMYRWEREDLVPIRPLEGEELPCDMLGHQERKKLKDLHLPNLGLGELRMPHVQLPEAIRKLTRSGTREREVEV
uniref:Uncharacterized protein n=1 Tax=Auxenochlorella protothecoides TaxID=3075 RepID=A0A1D1ZZN3_AUXPR